ncbi:MAG: hypothetical protein J4431_00960 [Candidatus Aenigmarchaeota archaeon]|nr:hypothetical protein [Candidatus Aenigmarchaeota archaeon]
MIKSTTIYVVNPAGRWPGYAQFHCTKDGIPCEPRKADISVEITGGRITVSGEWPRMEIGRHSDPYMPQPLYIALNRFVNASGVPDYLKAAVVTSMPLPEQAVDNYLRAMERLDNGMPSAGLR